VEDSQVKAARHCGGSRSMASGPAGSFHPQQSRSSDSHSSLAEESSRLASTPRSTVRWWRYSFAARLRAVEKRKARSVVTESPCR